ncbi:MAG: hypothetical protein AAF696_22260 [Bacteroidota bacterium]
MPNTKINSFFRIFINSSLIFSLFLISCEPELIIPDTFDPYVEAFIEAGAERGVSIDLEEDGLEIRFTENRDIVSNCNVSANPQLITISKAYWEAVGEREKHRLMFEMLGRCVLNRTDRNELTEDHEFLSIIHGQGSPAPNIGLVNRVFNVWGFRWEYYLDELFDSNTPLPFWNKTELRYDDISPADKESLLLEDFADNQRGWFVDSTESYQGKIENGIYYFSAIDDSFFPSIDQTIDQSRNFEIEIRIKNLQRGMNLIFGGERRLDSYNFILSNFYGTSGTLYLTDQFDYFSLFREGLNTAPDFETKGFATQPVPSLDLAEDAFHTLTVRRLGNLLYFFADEEFLYVNDYEAFTGGILGFLAASRRGDNNFVKEIWVDYLKVDYIP